MEKLHAFGEGAEFNKTAPESFTLVKVGKNRFTRNNKVREFDVTPEDIDAIMEEFESRGKDLVLDFGHSSLNPDAGFKGDAPAAGWCDRLEKTADGIVGHVKEWTAKGKERIEGGEYKYHSPVLFFDEKTGRPNALHSAAVTNIPAIHGAPKLVAASDFWIDDEKPEEIPVVAMEENMKMATECVDNIRNIKSELNEILVSMSDMADSEEKKKELTEFADNLFKEDIEAFQEQAKAKETSEPVIEPEAFQDIEAEYASVSNTMNGDDLLAWLSSNASRLATELEKADEADKGAIQLQLDFITEKQSTLNAFKETNPDLWAKGLISKPAEEAVPAPQAVALSDSIIELFKDKKHLAFSDIDPGKELSMENVESEMKALYDYKESTMKALEDIGADSLESIKTAIDAVNEKALDVEAKSYVRMCIAQPECKITEVMQDWAVGAYKEDKEVFKKQYAGSPVAFSQNLIEVPKPEKSKAKVSQDQESIAIMMGHDPKEVYKD
jgi:phage I-like protein